MIKRLEEGFYVIDEDGHTDEKIVAKINEIIKVINAMMPERQKSEKGNNMIESHSEAEMLKGCIDLMQELTGCFEEYLDCMGIKPESDEERFCVNFTHFHNLAEGFMEANNVIRSMPTIDAAPVAHGRWTPYENEPDKEFHFCSECKAQAFNYEDGGEVVEVLPNYCHNCGAKMDFTKKESEQ